MAAGRRAGDAGTGVLPRPGRHRRPRGRRLLRPVGLPGRRQRRPARVRRFAWHRCLRIFPGLWVCLLVIAGGAALFAPLPDAMAFALRNALGQPHRWGIGTLFSDNPYGRLTGGGSVVNGSLWSLSFELFWYAVFTALTACGVIRRAPRLILLLTAGAYAVLLSDFLHQLPTTAYTVPQQRGNFGPIPLFGSLNTQTLVYLGFLFLLGASAQLYQHRIPVHPLLAATAAAVLLATLRLGAFPVLGYPAFAYLLLWAASTLPRWSHRIGRDHDYSYGICIYAFPTQQVLAGLGVHHRGLPVYIAASALATTVLAAASWHLVERPALRLKHWSPLRRARPLPTGDRPDLGGSGRCHRWCTVSCSRWWSRSPRRRSSCRPGASSCRR